MHHYCAIWSKTESAAEGLAARLEQFVHRRLIFEPDELTLHRVGARLTVFSAAVNQAALGIESPCHLLERRACLVGGLPTFERFPQYPPSDRMRPAAWLDELLERSDPQSLYLRVGGTFSVARAEADRITAFAAFSGYDSLFHLDNDLYTAVGNRASLVAALQRRGPHTETDRETLGWIPATTQILGHRTPWAEVRRVPTGHAVEVHRGALSLHAFTTDSHTALEAAGEPEVRAAAIDAVVERHRWYLDTGMRLEPQLTGGKDSRAGLALLLAAGGVDRIEGVRTIGAEDNGDVVVAREITTSLGIPHEVHAGPKAALDRVDWSEHQDWFAYSPWRYDLYLTPWDGREWISDAPSPIVAVSGSGGEVIRGGRAPEEGQDLLDAARAWFAAWYDRHNRLDVLEPGLVSAQRDYLQSEVAGMVGAGVVNLQQRFYVEHVLSNWGNAQLRAASNHAIAGLLDLDLARLMHARPDMDEELPYEILRRCAPELLPFPFADDRWAGRTLVRAEADGVAREPVESLATSNFPWQHALYRDWRDALIREVLRHASLWEGVVSIDRLEALLGTPVEPFRSSQVKALFGLLAATNQLRGELRADRDFSAARRPLRLAGSLAATAREWFAHRFAPAPHPVEAALAGATSERWRLPESTDGSASSRAQVARLLTADRRALAERTRELRRREREAEDRDRQLRAAHAELRIGRAEARAIGRSRSWRAVRAVSRLAAALGRGGLGTGQRLDRLTRLSPPDPGPARVRDEDGDAAAHRGEDQGRTAPAATSPRVATAGRERTHAALPEDG